MNDQELPADIEALVDYLKTYCTQKRADLDDETNAIIDALTFCETIRRTPPIRITAELRGAAMRHRQTVPFMASLFEEIARRTDPTNQR